MKRGQLKISFGMIFSIFLIVIFLTVGIYAITKILDLWEISQIESFSKDLQDNVNRIWRTQYGSEEESYNIPSKIDYVCFIDENSPKKGPKDQFYSDVSFASEDDENMIFYPIGSTKDGVRGKEIKNIDLKKITEKENPYCIPNKNGKVQIKTSMSSGEKLVTISR